MLRFIYIIWGHFLRKIDMFLSQLLCNKHFDCGNISLHDINIILHILENIFAILFCVVEYNEGFEAFFTLL